MNINNYESPRLAWHEASAVLQHQICKLVAENDSFVKQAVAMKVVFLSPASKQ